MANKIYSTGSPAYEYDFVTIQEADDDITQQLMSVPFPNTDSASTILFRFSGKEEEVTFYFPIVASSTDLSNGTAPAGTFPSGVKTIEEQIIFLRDYLWDYHFDASFTLYLDRFHSSGVECVITNMHFPNPPGRVNIIIASITIKRGHVGSF